MQIKQKCLVLSLSTYSVKDEKTGEKNEGITMFYLPKEHLNPEDDQEARGRKQVSLGQQPSKSPVPLDKIHKLVSAPAFYDITFQMVTRQLKAQLQAVDIDFVSNVELKACDFKAAK